VSAPYAQRYIEGGRVRQWAAAHWKRQQIYTRSCLNGWVRPKCWPASNTRTRGTFLELCGLGGEAGGEAHDVWLSEGGPALAQHVPGKAPQGWFMHVPQFSKRSACNDAAASCNLTRPLSVPLQRPSIRTQCRSSTTPTTAFHVRAIRQYPQREAPRCA